MPDLSISDILFSTVATIRQRVRKGDEIAQQHRDAGFSIEMNPAFPRAELDAQLDAMERLARQIVAAGEDNASQYTN